MKDVLAAPLGELITSIGEGVGQAQAALDQSSLQQTLDLYSSTDDEGLKLLREIGYQPTFYALPETHVEAQVSLSISNSSTTQQPSGGSTIATPNHMARTKIYATPVNASVTNKFNLQASGSASVKFKIVPVPPAQNVANIRVVPDFVGMNKTEVDALVADLGFTVTIIKDDTGVVKNQSLTPGKIIRLDTVIELEM